MFVAFPFRIETDSSGHWLLVPPYAYAKDGDDGEGSSGGDDGEGDDGGDDGEGGDDNDDGEGGDDGGEGEGGDDDDDDDDDDGEEDDDEDDEDEDEASEGGQGGKKGIWPVTVRKLANGAQVIYNDGSREEIVNGNFSRIDARGRVVEKRRARGSDLARMRAFFAQAVPQTEKSPSAVNSRAVKATYRGKNVDILYANGWREQITSGRFTLTDKYGRVVTSRRATQDDIDRLNRFRR